MESRGRLPEFNDAGGDVLLYGRTPNEHALPRFMTNRSIFFPTNARCVVSSSLILMNWLKSLLLVDAFLSRVPPQTMEGRLQCSLLT